MLEYSKHQDIRQRLWEELDRARAMHLTASREFDGVVQQGPTGVPYPDGSLRIQHAGRDSRSALQIYMRALKRFTDFTLNGTVPEDLL